MKICKKCGEEKEDLKFPKNKNGIVYENSICHSCRHLQAKQNDPEGINLYKRLYQRKYKEKNHDKTVLSSVSRYDSTRLKSTNNLTLDFVREQISKGCLYCGQTNNISLDRMDNSLPHNQDNVNPCCYRCNMLRGTCPYAAWLLIVPGVKAAADQGLFGNWREKSIGAKDRFIDEEHSEDNINCVICDLPMKNEGKKTCSRKCANQLSKQNSPDTNKVDWEKIDLEEETLTKSLEEIGRDLGVTGNTVKKRMKELGIPLRPKQKDLDLLCKMCANQHAKYSKYCGPECAIKDGGKPIVNWELVDLKKELETKSFKEIAKELNCEENAVKIRFYRFVKDKV